MYNGPLLCSFNVPIKGLTSSTWDMNLTGAGIFGLQKLFQRFRRMSSSVCHLSVTFVRSTQRVELFGNILHRLIAQGLGQFVLKFWAKKSYGVQGIVQVKYKGGGRKKLTFFDD